MFGNYLGSSSGGYYSPRDYKVNNPTFGGNTTFAHASGSRQGGYYYSPNRASDLLSNSKGSGEWAQSGSGAWFKR